MTYTNTIINMNKSDKLYRILCVMAHLGLLLHTEEQIMLKNIQILQPAALFGPLEAAHL